MVLLTQSASLANLFFQSSSSDVSASSTPASSMSTPNPRPGKNPEYPTLSVKTQLLYHKLKLEDEKDSSARVEHSRHAYYGTLWKTHRDERCNGIHELNCVVPKLSTPYSHGALGLRSHSRDAKVIYEHERWKLFHDYSDLVDAEVLLCGLKERKAVDETETGVEVF
ncbi:hypothetical protein C8J56DRAFT_899348 [Mycena floridula]|nr:hypothetical protein C8J56DRAFT_899348 [Mycena floridula]